MAHSTGLAGFTATRHIDLDVELAHHVGHLKRLTRHHAAGLTREVLLKRLAVDDDVALAFLDEDAGHGGLATPRAVIEFADHVGVAFSGAVQMSSVLGCWAV